MGLDHISLCGRCYLRHLSVPASSHLYLYIHDVLVNTLHTDYNIPRDRILGSGDTCPACIGLLQHDHGSSLISPTSLSDVCSVYSIPSSYCMGISIPSLCLFNDECIRAHHTSQYIIISVKDVIRALLVPVIDQVLHGSQSTSQSSFRIDINFNRPEADVELGHQLAPFITRTLPKNIGIKQLRRTSLTSAKFVDKAVSVMSQDELRAIPLQFHTDTVIPVQLSVIRDPVFITGSYTKFCRRLSQTPWFLGDSDNRMNGSVQDLIATPIIHEFGVDRQYKFHSAGREDIDVRMLGSGRQFILEITDPHRIPHTSIIHQLQNTINQSTDRVQVHSLSLTSDASAHFKILEDGAKTKTKSYRAIVWVSSPITDTICQSISTSTSFEIQQLTPIRVLHRRALISRARTIHRLMLSPMNSHFAILDLETQAGTYIKEFVHGDRGRTQPNLGSMLNCQADIIQLDVLDLHHQTL